MKKICQFGLLPLIILFIGCVEPYPPPVSNHKAGFLVVDAFLNCSYQSIQVKLSHAIPLDVPEIPIVETEATIRLEVSDGSEFPVNEIAPGFYTNSYVPIDINNKYRLHITTKENKVYVSDFLTLKQTPPIDELTWAPTDDGVKILVSTHDDSQKSIYYKWDFLETYIEHPAFRSFFKFENGKAVLRAPEDDIFTCWKYNQSTNIIIGTSNRLSSDVISNFPVTFLPVGTEKLYDRYSILVRQRVLTQEAYAFYEQLKKTTEELGGLFDPQPGQVLGNIKNLDNPSEIVVGYFDAGFIDQSRLFIEITELPSHLKIYQGMGDCNMDTVKMDEVFPSNGNNLVELLYSMGAPIGYTYSTDFCTDCTKQGGTLEKPSFW